MNTKVILTAVTAVMLSACGANNNEFNDTAQRDGDLTEPTRVNNINYGENGRTTEPGIDLTRTRNNQNQNESPKMEVADKAVEKITAIPEVDQANVIVTDDNAYVGASLAAGEGDKLTRDIERKISDQVKSVDQDIDNVYVSIDPDFNNRMNTYAEDIRNGEPIEGFFDEFNETVRRIFPTQR